MRAGVGKPTSMSAGVPGGCQGAWGDRGANLTLEGGVQLYGLTCPQVLTDDLLEAELGDLHQVPCGEAALVPGDLVDGACGDTDAVSQCGKGQARAACALLGHTCAHVFLLPGTPSPVFPYQMATGSAVLHQHKYHLCLLLVLDVPFRGTLSGPLHSPVLPDLSSRSRADPSQHHCGQHRPGLSI